MTANSQRDAAAIPLWNDAYINGADNLWGDPPVPYAEKAARAFLETGAFTVMDMPCGDGRNLPALARGGSVLIGADTSANALDISRKVLAQHDLAWDSALLEVDAYSTEIPDDSIGGIFCWDLLGHLTEPERAARELMRILVPGGRLIANQWTMRDCQVTDPNIREIESKVYVDHFDFYCRFYDRDDIDAFLDDAGLDAESVELEHWSEPPHAGYRDYEHDHESWVITIRKP